MSDNVLFPGHIRREEEQQILKAAEDVNADRKTRALVLYGPGGIGKTSMVRELARSRITDKSAIWIDPIDVDDTDYWLLSNLERRIVGQLDPEGRYFSDYLKDVSELPIYTRADIGYDAIVSHLGRIKGIFVDCYNNMIRESGKSVVIAFDTVEAIRGTYLLLTLTQWMKTLEATLFILSGRPVSDDHDGPDPILSELNDPHQRIPVTTICLGAFTEANAYDYLDRSSIAIGLTNEEKSKLVLLTRGHPLWLAFTISYLQEKGIPEEAGNELSDIRRIMPFDDQMTPAGQRLYDAFRARLVAPYREADFWHEADKRLAVAREGVNRSIWGQLISDLPPEEFQADSDVIWQQLLRRPWIRPRANGRYVTLHDAVAEELAQRIIPLHDQDQQWRRGLWRRMALIHDQLIEEPEREFIQLRAAFEGKLREIDEDACPPDERDRPATGSVLIQEAAELDVRKRDLDRFKADGFYYHLLSGFPQGSQRFLELFGQAKREHDVLFRDLLALEMQLFLPGKTDPYAFNDIIREVTREFHDWLPENAQTYIDIGIDMADYLIEKEQPRAAVELIDRLPTGEADLPQRFRLNILQGNAYMRIPGYVQAALPPFRRAVALADEFDAGSGERQKNLAEAHKELGFYYRNRGFRKDADTAYRQARQAISEALSIRHLAEDRAELASIQTNWAYVKGLAGLFQEGVNLVESAIAVRHSLGRHQEEGLSWGVIGEIYRFERRFEKAWEAYSTAERIFERGWNWYWLGLNYQKQAICLFQAIDDGIRLGPSGDPLAEAKRLITRSLDICRDAAVRGYPSALNRAGRIFGAEDCDIGLGYLVESIEQAQRLADGWYWFAGLVEYAELSYRAWVKTGRDGYRNQIQARTDDIKQAISEYHFPDLRGRWNVVLGHLALHDWEVAGDAGSLSAALRNYKEGFEAIAAEGHAGSSGPSVIPTAFKTFGDLFRRLPADVRAEWYEELRRAWLRQEKASTLLLPRLEELY